MTRSILLAAVAFVALVAPGTASAQETIKYYWRTDVSSGSWNNPLNWASLFTPTTSVDEAVFDSAPTVSVSGFVPQAPTRVWFRGGSGVTDTQTITIHNQFTLSHFPAGDTTGWITMDRAGAVVFNDGGGGSLVASSLAGQPGEIAFRGSGTGVLTINVPIKDTTDIGSNETSVTKFHGSTVVLGSTNTYTGGTSIYGGVLSVTGDGNLGTSTSWVEIYNNSRLQVTGSALSRNIGVGFGGGGGIRVPSGGTVNYSGIVGGSGNFVKDGPGTLVMTSANSYIGDTIINSGAIVLTNSGTPGHINHGEIEINGGQLRFERTETLILGNKPFRGAGTVVQAGMGTTILSGEGYSPNFTGNVFVNAGTFQLNDANQGEAIFTNNMFFYLNGGTLRLAGGNTFGVHTATTGPTVVINSGSLVADNGTFNTIQALAFFGGSVYLGDPSNGAGGVYGTLAIRSHIHTHADASITGTPNAFINLGQDGETQFDVSGANTLTIGVRLANNANPSSIPQATGLLKSGPGTMVLSGANTYTGTTNVSGGKLLVNGDQSAATGQTTVQTGATLGGSGTLGGGVTVNNGGTLAPGNSAGILTVNGNLVMSSGSVFAVELNGTTAGTQYDRLVVKGTSVNLNGATLQTALGYAAAANDLLFIIDNQGTFPINGTFAGINQGGQVTLAGGTYTAQLSYFGDLGSMSVTGGNDVVLYNFQPVPEPGAVLVTAAAGLGLVVAVRRRIGARQFRVAPSGP